MIINKTPNDFLAFRSADVRRPPTSSAMRSPILIINDPTCGNIVWYYWVLTNTACDWNSHFRWNCIMYILWMRMAFWVSDGILEFVVKINVFVMHKEGRPLIRNCAATQLMHCTFRWRHHLIWRFKKLNYVKQALFSDTSFQPFGGPFLLPRSFLSISKLRQMTNKIKIKFPILVPVRRQGESLFTSQTLDFSAQLVHFCLLSCTTFQNSAGECMFVSDHSHVSYFFRPVHGGMSTGQCALLH